jgi:hypothetical protein
MTHADLIEHLGGGTAIAAWLVENTDARVDREAVYKWAQNSVPWRWRGHLAQMANEKGVALPDDFIPGVLAQ